MEQLLRELAAAWVAAGHTALEFDQAMIRLLAMIQEAEDEC